MSLWPVNNVNLQKKWARFLHGDNLNREWLQSLNSAPLFQLDFAGAGEGARGQAVKLKHTEHWVPSMTRVCGWYYQRQTIPLLFDLASSRAEKHPTHSGKSRLFSPTSEFGRNDCSPDRLFSAPISHLALLSGRVLCLPLSCSWPQEAGPCCCSSCLAPWLAVPLGKWEAWIRG